MPAEPAMQTAESLLAAGDPAAALRALQQQVRGSAADPKLRVFLFQLLCVLGQWQRALDQLKVCGELDPGTLAMVSTYRAAVQCEGVRDAVFDGRSTPHVFGPPANWVALLAQALQLDAQGHAAQAAALRAQAFDEAPASPGQADGQAFGWIADADSRLGPVLEVIINGRYGWLPFIHLNKVDIEPVADLRDLVWAPAHIEFVNGADTVALLPTRYPGSAQADDAALQLARRTDWLPLAEGQYRGLGQRVLATDGAESGLLELRSLVLEPAAAAAAP
jgi:type VI secretion system protein ImpE